MIPIGGEDSRASRSFGVWMVIAANVYVFFQEFTAADPEAFINRFALIPYHITRNIVLPPPSPSWPWLTLLTSQFFHAGILHIAANMLFLFVFGPEIEYLTGTLNFITFYLLCGVCAGIAQYSVAPLSHVPSLGASGAIAGVLGAYLLRFPTNRVRAIIPIGCFPVVAGVPAIFIIGIWALTQFVHGFAPLAPHALSEQNGGVAYFAHIGGFLAGVFLIGFFSTRTPKRRRRARCA